MSKLKKLLAEIKARLDAFEQGVANDFVKVTVDGVDYYDTKEKLTHQECLDLAKKHGLRVLERWELCKMYDESEAARKSLADKYFWSASVYSFYCYEAWQFSGPCGKVSSNHRSNTNGARCVGDEEVKVEDV